jgi:hypothetical protein
MKLFLKSWLSNIGPLKTHYNRSLFCDLDKLVFDEENNIIMDWSCKCGCSIAISMMFEHLGLLKEAKKLKNKKWVHAYRRSTYTPKHPVSHKSLCDDSNFLFKVVRNPYTRIVSSYIHVCRYIKQNLLELKDIGTYRQLTFRQFVALLENRNIKFDIDPHCRMQTKNYERRNLRQPVIFKLETLAQDVEKINAACNVNYSLQGLTAHHHADKNAQNIEFSADESFASFDGVYPDYNYFYDQKNFEKVTQLYKEDIERYEYDFPWEEIT